MDSGDFGEEGHRAREGDLENISQLGPRAHLRAGIFRRAYPPFVPCMMHGLLAILAPPFLDDVPNAWSDLI